MAQTINIVMKKALISSASVSPRQMHHVNNIAQSIDDISALIKISFVPNIVVNNKINNKIK